MEMEQINCIEYSLHLIDQLKNITYYYYYTEESGDDFDQKSESKV